MLVLILSLNLGLNLGLRVRTWCCRWCRCRRHARRQVTQGRPSGVRRAELMGVAWRALLCDWADAPRGLRVGGAVAASALAAKLVPLVA